LPLFDRWEDGGWQQDGLRSEQPRVPPRPHEAPALGFLTEDALGEVRAEDVPHAGLVVIQIQVHSRSAFYSGLKEHRKVRREVDVVLDEQHVLPPHSDGVPYGPQTDRAVAGWGLHG